VTACRPLALTASESVAGLVKDLSPWGAIVLVGYAFLPGTLLVIELGASGNNAKPILSRVVGVTACGRGKWLLKCAFRSPLAEELLRACLAEGCA
jgi:hypothetical protein